MPTSPFAPHAVLDVVVDDEFRPLISEVEVLRLHTGYVVDNRFAQLWVGRLNSWTPIVRQLIVSISESV